MIQLHESMTFWLAIGKITAIKDAAFDFEILTAEKLRAIDKELKRKQNTQQEEEEVSI